MIGLDTNILVRLAVAAHPARAITLAVVQTEASRNIRLMVPTLVATEFLHVVTDQRRFEAAMSMAEALDWLKDFLANGAVSLLHPTDEAFRQTMVWMRQFHLGRKRILDTHLAAILYTSGVKRLLTANPSDFQIFNALEIVPI
jgi:predicted nucleic acid-binding protein